MRKIKKIKPRFTTVITTARVYTADEVVNGIININNKKGELMLQQEVISVGSTVRDISPGDLVQINLKNYALRKYEDGSLKDGVITENPVMSYNIPIVEMNDTKYLMLQDRDIDYVIEEWEDEEAPQVIVPDKGIIL